MSDSTKTPRDAKGKWLPGYSPNRAGRPAGSRSKLNEDFLRDTLAAWRKHGPSALDKAAEAEPMQFCKMVAGILPKQVDVSGNLFDELLSRPVDELERRLAELQAERDARDTDESRSH